MLMPVFAADVFRVDAFGLGVLLTLSGVGGLIGSLVVAYFADIRRKGLVQLVFGLLFGVGLIAFAATNIFWIGLVMLVFTGIASNAFAAFNSTMIMLNTPQRLFGRVMSLYLITFGLMPVALLPLSALADIYGAQAVTAGCGVVILAVMIAVLIFGRRHWGADSPAVRPE
jgi:MFS family permease